MSANSRIEWTDTTWNPTTGCSKISPGCKNCYAERMSHRLRGMGQTAYQSATDGKGREWNEFPNVAVIAPREEPSVNDPARQSESTPEGSSRGSVMATKEATP